MDGWCFSGKCWSCCFYCFNLTHLNWRNKSEIQINHMIIGFSLQCLTVFKTKVLVGLTFWFRSQIVTLLQHVSQVSSSVSKHVLRLSCPQLNVSQAYERSCRREYLLLFLVFFFQSWWRDEKETAALFLEQRGLMNTTAKLTGNIPAPRSHVWTGKSAEK